MDTTRKHSISRDYESPLDHPERIISVYRGWNVFERQQGFDAIIDFDLTDVDDTANFNSREEILLALEAIRHNLDAVSDEEEFLRAKVNGSIFYLRALMGEDIPFSRYVENTLGITPRRFQDNEIDKIRSKVEILLAGFGLELKPNYGKEFEKRFIIHDPNIIKLGIVEGKDFWVDQLRKRGVPCPAIINLRVEFAEVDAYWSNWLSGSYREGFILRINLHSRKKYDLGKPQVLCLHELCGHAVQMSIWGELIREGKISPACGITTVHSPEAFVAEGLGQTIPDFLGKEEDFPAEFNLSRWLHYYALVVLHNAHIMSYENEPVAKVLAFAEQNLPFWSPDAIAAEVRDRITNPLNRTYQLSYAAAEHMIRRLIKNFPFDLKDRFLREIYTKPMTPNQLQKMAKRVNF